MCGKSAFLLDLLFLKDAEEELSALELSKLLVCSTMTSYFPVLSTESDLASFMVSLTAFLASFVYYSIS